MQATSPLGQYAAPVAAAVALGIIAAYVAALIVPGAPPDAAARLEPLALLAIGAVLGSSVAVNGYKAPVNAAHARIDRLQAAVEATATIPAGPKAAQAVASILAADGSGDPPPAQAGGVQPGG